MIVKQPSYTWIAVVAMVVLVMTVLFGISISFSDLLNWNTHGAGADATRASITEQALSNSAARAATATRVALDSKNDAVISSTTGTAVAMAVARDQQALQFAPTQTVLAETHRHVEQIEKDKSSSALLEDLSTLLLILGVVAIGAVGGVAAYRLSFGGLARLKDARTRQLEKEIELSVAETQRLEKQIQSLRERRRYAELILSSKEHRSTMESEDSSPRKRFEL